MRLRVISWCAASAAALAMPAISGATSLSELATDNSTVQPAGPRTGTNGQKFFNVEGSGNNQFASFGVVDFSGSSFSFGSPVSGINSASLVLTESDASFTHPGALNLYLTQDTTTNIDAGTSPLKYDNTSLPDGIGTQLTPHDLVGTATFTSSGSAGTGTVDTYALTLSAADKTYLINQLNGGGDIRLIVAPGDASVSATYAGFINTTQGTPGPMLTIDASTGASVPEPASLGLLGIAALLGLRSRRA